jgi:hypothetical protein
MRFLLRMAFWLGVVAVLLPRDGTAPASSAQISATDAMSAATATVGDMRQFCERQPDACSVGSQAAVAIEDRAKAGAKRLYDMLNERLAAGDNDHAITVTAAKNAGAVPLPPPRPAQHAASPAMPSLGRNAAQATAPGGSQHTLTPADMAPAWQLAPPPRKDARGQPA